MAKSKKGRAGGARKSSPGGNPSEGRLEASSERPSVVAAEGVPARLHALDAYRGFAMLAMVSGGFAIGGVAEGFAAESPDSPFAPLWRFLAYQLEHVPWTGCSAWDLIQPSFMFIVGVAMPWSLAARRAKGDSEASIRRHVLFRAAVLTLLGVFLRSNGRSETNWTFEDVVSQIGLGYAFVFAFLGRGFRVQMSGTVAILLGYWLLFALWPPPAADFDPVAIGMPEDWRQFPGGLAAHWNKHANPAGAFDRWFLNLFPRSTEFLYNGGGYATLSFIPSMATMLIGAMAGEFLRTDRRPLIGKIRLLAGCGAACLAFGFLVDGNLWPGALRAEAWALAPVVKRIWTPSWAVFAAGWTLLLLAAFLHVIDHRGLRRWAFPFVVVGMNSTAMYVMSWLFKPWVRATLRTHLGADFLARERLGGFMPVVESFAVTTVLFLVCLWMYRRRVFLRI